MKTFLLFMLGLINALSQMRAQETNKSVLPSELANREGNAALALFSGAVPEYQQLFRATALPAEWNMPVRITGISFRVNGGSGSMDAVIPRFEIRLSTSERTPEQMTASYLANRGMDEVSVFSRENIHFVSEGSSGPTPFDLKFQFDTPFLFDSKRGNLLMYFAHEGAAGPLSRSIDAEGYQDINSAPVAAYYQPGPVPQAYGVITQFDYVTIPEPISLLFLFVGASVILTLRRPIS